MSKPIGISRVRRKRVSNVIKNKSKSVLSDKSHENKSISNLFNDIDLSDINLSCGNISFKSTKSILNCGSNERSRVDINDSNISDSFVTKSLINGSNSDQNQTKVNKNSSFKSTKNWSKFESDIKCTASTSNANKRKGSSVFEDIDLSDLNTETSMTSFQSSRKVFRTEDNNRDHNSDNYPNLSNKENDSNCEDYPLPQVEEVVGPKSVVFTKPLKSFNDKNRSISDLNAIQSTVKSNDNQILDNIFSQDFELDFDISMTSPQKSKEEKTEETTHKNLRTDKSVFDNKSIESKPNNGFKTITKSSISLNSSEFCDNTSKEKTFSDKRHNIFKDFDLSDLKTSDSLNLNSFQSVSKALKSDYSFDGNNVSKYDNYSSFFLTDSKSNRSLPIPETVRKSIIVDVFENFDLKDLNFNESNISFQNSRTAFQPLKSIDININDKNTIDWNDINHIFNQSFSESNDFISSSPKPKTSSPKNKSKTGQPLYSSPKPESKISQEIDFSFEIDEQFFDSCIERTEQTSLFNKNLSEDSNEVKVKNDSEDSFDSLEDISFSLRSDFATYNEMTSEQFFTETKDQNIKDQSFENQSFMGFRSGTGHPISFSEEQISAAKLIFKDLEEWLLKEIDKNKDIFIESNQSVASYSQKFVSDIGNGGQTIEEEMSVESFAHIMSKTDDN